MLLYYLKNCFLHIIYIYINIYIHVYISGGTKFMLLENFTKHPSRSTADHIFKSVLCGRCGLVNYYPLLNVLYIYIRF
jgi:hypothetical protein